MNKKPLARTRNIVVQNSNEEILIYDLDEHRAFCLNKTVADIWRSCDGTRSVDEIVAHLNQSGAGSVNVDLVHLALLQMSENSLLVENDSFSILRPNVSRRTLIRNAALATTIALPVISNLVAPTAASAQSTCVNPGGLAPNTPVTQFTDAGGCRVLLQEQCCTGAVSDYVFVECCSSSQAPGVGNCDGICT